jgi:hypothetical protein
MSYTLVLNSSNVTTNKNTYVYNFISNNFTVKDNAEICVSNITMPYSWFNVTSSYNNKSFQFTWTVGTTSTTYTITLPDGFYLISDIQNYIELYCQTNGFYLINASGQYVYYLKLYLNSTYYSVQLLTYLVPTSLPTGYTAPSNFAGYPTTSTAPSFIVLNNNFTNLIGFVAGTYGGGTSNSSINSSYTPTGSTVNSIIVRCSLVSNNVGFPSDILDSFSINATFGSNITYYPSFEKWVKIKNGTYNNLIITFVDQNFNNISILDPSVCVTLMIKQ